jgi:hypothetical protein
MRYVVIINLDYQNYDQNKLKSLFAVISTAMQENGFIVDGRRFTIDAEPGEAQRLARFVIDEVEREYSAIGESVYTYIREFFGFEVALADNLLLPPNENIEVSELEDIEGIHLINFLRK